jgi:hypothetical protein
MFGEWVVNKYGSLDAALAAWKGEKLNRDVPAEGRIAFRTLWNIFSEKTARDQDTATFLFEVQTKFYQDTIAFLRQLGFRESLRLPIGPRPAGSVWAFGETQLCNGRFHRPSRLL